MVLCCALSCVLAIDNKKISLEDIERDNLKSNKETTPKAPGSPTNFGFVPPIKTANDYAKQPSNQYLQPPYVPPQSYTTQTQQQYITPPQQQSFPQQYTTVQQYVAPQKYQQQVSSPQYVTPQQYLSPQQYTTAQQYAAPQQYYYQQGQGNQYQQYENVQYITDNSIAQQPQQQYYTPQYVYLQQYTAPSTPVQTVVDPKSGLQYVMYVPTYVPKGEQTQNYETTVAYVDPKATQPEQAYVQNTQYVSVPQVTPSIQYAEETPKYVQSNIQAATPSIRYAEETPKYVQSNIEAAAPSIKYAEENNPKYVQSHVQATSSLRYAEEKPRLFFTSKQEPKSLLDSYIPSILQIQYYKQQQARANALQQSLKVAGPVAGKTDYVKYRPAETQQTKTTQSASFSNYQTPK